MRLENILADLLEVPAETISDDSSPDTMANWTSLRNVTLLVAIEKAYGIKFTNTEMFGMRSVSDIRRTIEGKGVPVG